MQDRKTVVICEKPSQARNLRAALGGGFGEILPAQGHLVRLKLPDETKEEWSRWSADVLHPGAPYEKVAADESSARAKLKAIQQAMKGAGRVIIATDCDREGHLIGQEIVDFCGFRGEVLRAMFNKEDPTSLKEAFRRLKPASDYSGLYASGRAREQADQICNLSLTRAATVTLKQPGSKGAIGIGRVKTPTLSIVCHREIEILDFKPEDYFEIRADTHVEAGNFILTCAGLPAELRKAGADGAAEEGDDPEATEDDAALDGKDSLAGRIRHRRLAEMVAAAATGWRGPLSVEIRDCAQNPPKLYDLTALQAACSARFGWTGERTLTIAQTLYSEHQIITYPRAEGRHLGDNQIPEAGPLAQALVALPDFRQYAKLVEEPVIRRGKNGTFSDKALEGSSHHGIAPNFNMRGRFADIVPTLSADEARLWDLVARSYMAALAPDFRYRQTLVEAQVPCAVSVGGEKRTFQWQFRASGRVPVDLGWREILGAPPRGGEKGAGTADEDDEPDLPDMKDGESATIEKADVTTRTTRPPSRYTEGTLLKAMKEAWRFVEDREMRAKLKETEGIGTPATRSSIVKSLFDQGQLLRKGKQVLPSEAGLELYRLLLKVAPDLTDPARTAAWETIFTRVEQGRMDFMQAVDRLAGQAKKTIDEIVQAAEAGNIRIAAGKAGKPSEKMLRFAMSVAERAGLKLPAEAKKDAAACRAFLDAHAPKREEGEARTPSEKQLAFARKVASAAGVQLPSEALEDARALSAWLDTNKSKAAFPPSEKQLQFARNIADEQGLDLPADAAMDARACSAFIDRHFRKNGGGSRGSGKTSGPAGQRRSGAGRGAGARRGVPVG